MFLASEANEASEAIIFLARQQWVGRMGLMDSEISKTLDAAWRFDSERPGEFWIAVVSCGPTFSVRMAGLKWLSDFGEFGLRFGIETYHVFGNQ